MATKNHNKDEKFDYGGKREDGQHENYPVNTEPERVAPYRDTYVHDTCGRSTGCGSDIAETYARDPKYYSRTFCVHCGNHYPVSEFKWTNDGVRLGEIG